MILPVLLALPSPGKDSNVTLDDEKLKDEVPAGLQKVELDLDDALFLEFENEEEPPAEKSALEEPAKELEEAPASEKKRFSKKLLVIILAALTLLVLGGLGAYFFLQSSPETTTNATAPSPNDPRHDVPPEAAHETPHKPREIVPRQPVFKPYFLEPFQIEFTQGNTSRFLTCRIIIPDVNEITYLEIGTRIIPVRDAVYTYLKSTPVSLLDDPNYADKLKQDLTAALNKVIKSSELKMVLIEDYVVK